MHSCRFISVWNLVEQKATTENHIPRYINMINMYM